MADYRIAETAARTILRLRRLRAIMRARRHAIASPIRLRTGDRSGRRTIRR
jgi:hypothetical protein